MSTGAARQQSRLLPYLLVVLVVLLAYVVYTRVLQRSAPVAVSTPTPAVATPAPAQAEPTPAPAASPAASPAPVATVVPNRPSGRANPFAALVVERPPTPPSPPPPPAVPPPFFPGQPGGPAGGPGGGGTKLAGVLMKDGEALAIVQLGNVTYIVAEGDVVEQFRVARIEPERVILRSGPQELSLELGGEQR